jgi:hypothetical protein
MGDVFYFVCNFHVPLGFECWLSVQWCRSVMVYLLACWSDGYFLWCCIFPRFSFLLVCILLFLIRGVSRLLVEFLRVQENSHQTNTLEDRDHDKPTPLDRQPAFKT